jgi:type IV pilus assembly protein PilV
MKRQGYTLIEVMTAVVVMTIGATGIVAMQGAAVRANQDAYETTTAINFATTWLERVKRDARRWNAVGGADLAAGNNAWLNNAIGSNAGLYFVPTTTAPEQAAADYYGFDTPGEFNALNGGSYAFFCANLRLTVAQAYNAATNGFNPVTAANAIRADVRVWWHRSSSDANRNGTYATCRNAALDAAGLTNPAIRKTYLSTVVSYRTPGWP